MRAAQTTLAIFFGLGLAAPLLAQESGAADSAADTEEPIAAEESLGKPLAERIPAVTHQTFLKKNRFELTPSLGFSVDDAFFRNYILQLDGAYHIFEYLSVEGRVGWPFFGEALDPVVFLDAVDRPYNGITRPVYLADVAVSFTPLYGKNSVFAEFIWHYDLYVTGGAGITGIGALSGNSVDFGEIEHHPTLTLGGGMRAFVTDWMVVHVDLRDRIHFYLGSDSRRGVLQNLMVLSVGVGFWFPFTFEYDDNAYGVVS